ncbi:hypothetical protein [Pseudoalteromonas sp.]|uniref:hypothetical protein n=1 Tax=Pseudoalteromonas sp. TaxID=53249 RepID=UPI0023523359|nr:hypothetical protein [Pseudoalteromonas sp.]
MIKLIVRISNVIFLLLSVVWLARAPDWEPLILSLSFFSAFIIQEVILYRKLTDIKTNTNISNIINESDRQLFSKFKAELSSKSELVEFLQNHDFGNSFSIDKTQSLDSFILNWDNAEHEFDNHKLEVLRKLLLKLMSQLNTQLSISVHPIANGWVSIGFDDSEDRPKMFVLKDKLNQLATKIFDTHQELIRTFKCLNNRNNNEIPN